MTKDLHWKQWIGKVVATEDEIKAALKRLNREPKDAKELQENVLKERHKTEDKMISEINKQLYSKL